MLPQERPPPKRGNFHARKWSVFDPRENPTLPCLIDVRPLLVKAGSHETPGKGPAGSLAARRQFFPIASFQISGAPNDIERARLKLLESRAARQNRPLAQD